MYPFSQKWHRTVLESLARNNLDIHDSSNFWELGVIQSNGPVLADLLTRLPKNDGKLPQDVCATIQHLLTKLKHTHHHSLHPPSCYAPCGHADSWWNFFFLLCQWSEAVWHMQQILTLLPKADDCCKSSYGHPSLTPGIFTIYCPHGVGYGFQVMRNCESPHIPFHIFTSWFQTPMLMLISTVDLLGS